MAEVVVAIDSNIFISVINKERDSPNSKKILDWIDDGKTRAIVSTIVIAEIVSGYQTSGELKEKDEFMEHILGASNYGAVDVTVPIALDAGNLRAQKGFRLPDALIAASALHHNAKFLISNDDHFGKIGLESLKVVTGAEFVKSLGKTVESKSN